MGGRGCSRIPNLTSGLGPGQGPLCCPHPQPLLPQAAATQGEFWPPRSLTEGAGGRHLNLMLCQPYQPSPPAPGHSLKLSCPAGVPLPPPCPQKANIQGDGLRAAALPVALALSRADTAARLLRKPEPALGM